MKNLNKNLLNLIFMTFIAAIGLGWPSTYSAQDQVVKIVVTEDGFEPASVNVKPGVPVTLSVIRKTDSTCATSISIPSKKINQDLPLNKEVKINLGKLDKGEIRYSCSMDMITGVLQVK